MIELSLDNEVVIETDFFFDFVDRVAREARNNTIDQRIAEMAVLLDPIDEILPQFVVLRMLDDVFMQRRAVVLDQLAADDAKTFRRVAVKVLETLVKQRRHLGRIRFRGTGIQIVTLLVTDTCLGRIRDGDFQFGREEIVLVLFVINVRIERIHHALNQTDVLLGLFVLNAFQIDMIEILLFV